MLVSRGIADVKSWTQNTRDVGAVACRAIAAGPLRFSWTALRGLALVALVSTAAMAHESATDEMTVSIEATAHGSAVAAIEVPEPTAAAAPPSTPVAEAPSTPVAAPPPSTPAAEAPSTSTPAVVTAPAKPLDLSPYAPGTIVVQTSERKLHLVLGRGEVVTYPVGVGKSGKAWSGTAYIRGKFIAPAWSPPKAVKREKPHLPNYIPGGVPSNPMGAAAMTLSVDQYAIHGTNVPSSIGTFASFGCIRMHNRDVLDLYKRVSVGTKVVVLN
jgi:lipoprotein-anchoring transpeptidase ErfK/SrfK